MHLRNQHTNTPTHQPTNRNTKQDKKSGLQCIYNVQDIVGVSNTVLMDKVIKDNILSEAERAK